MALYFLVSLIYAGEELPSRLLRQEIKIRLGIFKFIFCNCKNCLRNTQNLKNISPSKKQKQCIRFPSPVRNINRKSFWFRAIKLVHKKSYPLNEFSLTFWLTPVLLRLAAVHYRDYDWNYLWTDDGQMWWNLSKKALVCICRVTIDFKQN